MLLGGDLDDHGGRVISLFEEGATVDPMCAEGCDYRFNQPGAAFLNVSPDELLAQSVFIDTIVERPPLSVIEVVQERQGDFDHRHDRNLERFRGDRRDQIGYSRCRQGTRGGNQNVHEGRLGQLKTSSGGMTEIPKED